MEYYSLSSHNRSYSEAVDIYEARIRDSKEVFEKFSNSFIERECPYCGSDRSVNHDLFDGNYNIDKCLSCANIFVNPAPSIEAINYYYNNCECNNMLGSIYRKRHNTNGFIASLSNFMLILRLDYVIYSANHTPHHKLAQHQQ